MQKSKLVLLRDRKRPPIIPSRLQHGKSAGDVCLNELGGPRDRSIDMAFRCEMNNGVRLKLGEGPRYSVTIANVRSAKFIIRAIGDRVERSEVGGVCQF